MSVNRFFESPLTRWPWPSRLPAKSEAGLKTVPDMSRSAASRTTSVEEAEQVAARYREEPPFRFLDRAVSWMPAETWIPDGGEWYAVRIRQADGSEIRREAFYDAGNRYPEERGFYESDRRSATRLENVTAWIDPDYMDSEEWYDGKPQDFSYSPIEELDLNVPVWNRLKKHGIHLIRDIFKTDKDTLLKTVVVRRKWMEELSEKLKRAGFEAEW